MFSSTRLLNLKSIIKKVPDCVSAWLTPVNTASGATWVGHDVNLSYSQSNSQADNYTAARDFKAVTRGREGGPLIPGNVVGSSAYSAAKNQEIGLALRHDGQKVGLSSI